MIRLIGNRFQLLQALAKAVDDKKLWVLTEYKSGRTRSQNAYYWELIGQLAGSLHMSRPYLHNIMLRRYGTDFSLGGKIARVPLPNTDKTETETLESETYHLRPTSQVMTGKDGVEYRTYVLLKGSHDMNTAEFSVLLNGLVAECRNCGIETLTPQQLAEMRDYAEQHHH